MQCHFVLTVRINYYNRLVCLREQSYYKPLQINFMNVVHALKKSIYLHPLNGSSFAAMAELVDASDLGSGAFGRGGSTPSSRTFFDFN